MTLDKRPYSPYLISLLGGIVTALFSLLPHEEGVIVLLVNYLACVPVAMVFLSMGVNCGIFASFISMVLVLLSQGTGSMIILGGTHLLPCSLIAAASLKRQQIGDKLQWYPAGYLVSWLTVLCGLYLIFFVAIVNQQGSDPQTLIKQTLVNVVGSDILHHLSPLMLDLLPGLMCISLSIMALVNLSMAQRICRIRQINIRPYPTGEDSQFCEFWDIVFIGSIMLILTDGQIFAFIGKNMMLVSCFPLFFMGLSTVNCWLGQFRNGPLWLGILVVLCALLLWPSFIVVGLGLLEPTLNIKKRLIVNKDLD